MDYPANKICVVTGSRAEYGLLRWVMHLIQEDPGLQLQIIATGAHLSPEFGRTDRVIESDGFLIDRKVEMLTSSDTPVGIAKSMGLGLIGFSDAWHDLKPDLIVVLGDRFEIFSAVASALVARIPVAHVHGGELTEGAYDDALRHSITKMSHFHFVAADEYRRRVIQLGEDPDRVFLVGGLGVDTIKRIKLLSREELESSLGLKLGRSNLLISFHPPTLDRTSPEAQMRELLAALEELVDTQLIFTMPNADTGGRALAKLVDQFVARHENAHAYISLGQQRYLSCVAHMDGVLGNSSSGLLEVPSFKKGTVNIGDRQGGRLKASSVIDCKPDRKSIHLALQKLYSDQFQSKLDDTTNPYGEGGASDKIVQTIKAFKLNGPEKKRFYDLC